MIPENSEEQDFFRKVNKNLLGEHKNLQNENKNMLYNDINYILNWKEHVESWTENALGIPVKTIRYEDLLEDTAAVVREATTFAGLEISDERLVEAVELSSFENMKAMEEKEIREKREGMFYLPQRASGNAKGFRFMNRGKRGWSQELLPPDVLDKARGIFAPQSEKES